MPDHNAPERHASVHTGPAPQDQFSAWNLAVITTALTTFIGQLDMLRRMVAAVEKEQSSSQTSQLRGPRKHLTAQEKMAVERTVGEMHKSRRELFMNALEAHFPITRQELDEINQQQHHPFPPELVNTLVSGFTDYIEVRISQDLTTKFGDSAARREYASHYYASLTQPRLSHQLAEYLFPTVVNKFASFMGTLARAAVNAKGIEVLGDLPSVPMEIIRKYPSKEDYERWAVDQRIEQFVSSGFSEWRDTTLRWTGFTIETVHGDWNVMREAAARTRLLMRGTGGRVDGDYLKEIRGLRYPDVQMWDELRADPQYLELLLENAQSLSLGLGLEWAKYFFDHRNAHLDFFLDNVIDLETRRRWTAALALCEAMQHTFVHNGHSLYNLICINAWFCRKELGREDPDMRRDMADFVPQNYSERIGFAAVTGDLGALTSALDEAFREPDIDIEAQAAWLMRMPLLRKVMGEHEKVKQHLLELKRSRSRKRR